MKRSAREKFHTAELRNEISNEIWLLLFSSSTPNKHLLFSICRKCVYSIVFTSKYKSQLIRFSTIFNFFFSVSSAFYLADTDGVWVIIENNLFRDRRCCRRKIVVFFSRSSQAIYFFQTSTEWFRTQFKQTDTFTDWFELKSKSLETPMEISD